tara:strand:+ start:909 stop:1097 length:189 start_codon:yes stop_codon:yes gene_type:complete
MELTALVYPPKKVAVLTGISDKFRLIFPKKSLQTDSQIIVTVEIEVGKKKTGNLVLSAHNKP